MQVRISVAIVMPEIGLDEEPIRPVMRDDTVTKKKPKMTMSADGEEVALRRHLRRDGEEDGQRQRAAEDDDHRDVALGADLLRRRLPALKSFTLSRNDETIVGIVRARVISPDARTAPAPV